ncbi:hypothetical protein N9I71_04770, partial [Amylibacter sp.]|nr:hypothetical protein [Amylibacter sp.]
MSGIPPPAEPEGAGRSATIASVVINRPAIDAASSKAVRVGIVRRALEAPLRQIAENAGVDGAV